MCVCVMKETTKRGRELPCKKESQGLESSEQLKSEMKLSNLHFVQILKREISGDGRATDKKNVKYPSTVTFISLATVQ